MRRPPKMLDPTRGRAGDDRNRVAAAGEADAGETKTKGGRGVERSMQAKVSDEVEGVATTPATGAKGLHVQRRFTLPDEAALRASLQFLIDKVLLPFCCKRVLLLSRKAKNI